MSKSSVIANVLGTTFGHKSALLGSETAQTVPFCTFERSKTTVFLTTFGLVATLSVLVPKVMQLAKVFTLLFDMVPFGDFWSEK